MKGICNKCRKEGELVKVNGIINNWYVCYNCIETLGIETLENIQKTMRENFSSILTDFRYSVKIKNLYQIKHLRKKFRKYFKFYKEKIENLKESKIND